MEDLGLNLQNLKNNNNIRKIIKLIIKILIIIIMLFLIFKFFLNVSKNNHNQNNIEIIKSNVDKIKVDSSIKNVLLDSEQKIEIKKNSQDDFFDKSTILLDQDALNEKINEIDNIETNNDYKVLEQLNNKKLIENLKNKKYPKYGIKAQLIVLKEEKSINNFYKNIIKNYPELFDNKTFYIENIKLNNENFFRLKVGIFSSHKDGKNFCNNYIKYTNQDRFSCLVVNN